MTERIEFELNGTLYSELHDNEIEAFKVGANFYRSCMDVGEKTDSYWFVT